MVRAKKHELSKEGNEQILVFVHGHLEAFMDYGPQADLCMSCLSQASCSVLFFPNISRFNTIVGIYDQLFHNIDDNEHEMPDSLLMIVHGTSNVTTRHVREKIMHGTRYFYDEFDVVSCLAFSSSEIPLAEGETGNRHLLSFLGKVYPQYAGCGNCQHFLQNLALGFTFGHLGTNSSRTLRGDTFSNGKTTPMELVTNTISPYCSSAKSLLQIRVTLRRLILTNQIIKMLLQMQLNRFVWKGN